MGILATLRRLFGAPESGREAVGPSPHRRPGHSGASLEETSEAAAPAAPRSAASTVGASFVPSFQPFKAVNNNPDRYRFSYVDFGPPHRFQSFLSPVEVKWAKAFDRLGLQWEYEPLKFDMGPKHFSYTPDFRVAGISIADSNRPLFIEVKWFGEDMNLTKYVRFTEWYNCDLLVLGHYDRALWKRGQHRKHRPQPDLRTPKKQGYYLVLKCTHCGTYDWYPYNEFPTDDYIRLVEARPRWAFGSSDNAPERFLLGYRLEADGTFWLTEELPPSTVTSLQGALAGLMPFKDHPSACQRSPVERMVIPDCFVIQTGALFGLEGWLYQRGLSDLRITYVPKRCAH